MIFTPLASSSAGNAYLLEDKGSRILLECGLPIKKLRAVVPGLTGLTGCLITHEHKDHSRSTEALLDLGVPVWMTRGTAEALSCGAAQLIRAAEDRPGGFLPFAVGTIEVLPFTVYHDAAEPVGFYIRSRVDGERLLFATDTCAVPFSFPGLTTIAVEANFSEEILSRSVKLPKEIRKRIANSHMEIQQTCQFLRRLDKSRLREVYLIHLSDSHARESLFVDLVGRECPGVAIHAAAK